MRPWGDRNFRGNLTPHGWFAADYRTLLRNMFVREGGQAIHVLSVTSPEWIGPGRSIEIKRAPTSFGQVSYTLRSQDSDHAVLTFENRFSSAPMAIVVHLPWFIELIGALADGEPAKVVDGSINLPPSAHTVEFHWRARPNASASNYSTAVEHYKQEYRSRYEKLLHDGTFYRSGAGEGGCTHATN